MPIVACSHLQPITQNAMSKTLFILLALCGSLSAQIAGVGNGASFLTAVSTGSWAVVVGTFAGVNTATAPSFPVPTTLGGVQILVDGAEVPVYYVSSTQINFLTPAAATPGIKTLRVVTPSGNHDGTIRLISAAPGLFVKDAANPPKGAILNQDLSENTETNRIARGQTIVIYGTGPGKFDRAVTDGAAVPSDPLTRTTSTPQVFIAGVEAQVSFSGLAPGYPALWQINAAVPDQAFITGRVPVFVAVDGVESNQVTIFVQ